MLPLLIIEVYVCRSLFFFFFSFFFFFFFEFPCSFCSFAHTGPNGKREEKEQNFDLGGRSIFVGTMRGTGTGEGLLEEIEVEEGEEGRDEFFQVFFLIVL